MNHFQLPRHSKNTKNECTQRNKHAPQSTCSYSKTYVPAHIYSHVYSNTDTHNTHTPHRCTHTSVYYILTYTDTTHINTLPGMGTMKTCTWPAPQHQQIEAATTGSPFGKQYLILENAPVRETLSQPKILHDPASVSTWQNRKSKNSMWARPLNSAVWKEQMWRDHTIPNYQWMKKLGFQLADGRPAASMNVPEFIRVLQ